MLQQVIHLGHATTGDTPGHHATTGDTPGHHATTGDTPDYTLQHVIHLGTTISVHGIVHAWTVYGQFHAWTVVHGPHGQCS